MTGNKLEHIFIMSSFWNDVHSTTHPGQDTDNSNIIIVNLKLPEILNNIYSKKRDMKCFFKVDLSTCQIHCPKSKFQARNVLGYSSEIPEILNRIKNSKILYMVTLRVVSRIFMRPVQFRVVSWMLPRF